MGCFKFNYRPEDDPAYFVTYEQAIELDKKGFLQHCEIFLPLYYAIDDDNKIGTYCNWFGWKRGSALRTPISVVRTWLYKEKNIHIKVDIVYTEDLKIKYVPSVVHDQTLDGHIAISLHEYHNWRKEHSEQKYIEYFDTPEEALSVAIDMAISILPDVKEEDEYYF